MKPIKVLIIDDSAFVRSTLSKNLGRNREIEVVGTAIDPYFARDKIVELKPHVLVLDIEMPRMDGLTFLEKLMTYYPLPVIVLSSLAPEGSDSYFRALELGAVEVVSKPGAAFSLGRESQINLLIEKIKGAIHVNLNARKNSQAINGQYPEKKGPAFKSKNRAMVETTNKIIAVGASTGGVFAFGSIVNRLPTDTPPMVVVQHMPPGFTQNYAERLNRESHLEVQEAKSGDSMRRGLVLICPGNYHIQLKRSGAQYFVRLNQKPPVGLFRPSVDVLFSSVAHTAGKNAVGVVLTGMGNDGAMGIKEMADAGAKTIFQDKKSCVVFGMPEEAALAVGRNRFTPLTLIPKRILELSI